MLLIWVMARARSHWFIVPLPFHRLFSNFPSLIQILLLTKRIRRRVEKRAPINPDRCFILLSADSAGSRHKNASGKKKQKDELVGDASNRVLARPPPYFA
jgi:hypothetical protein